jgi:hypothetical protein
MELPIVLVCDTTENWNNATTAILQSELGIEITPSGKKYLLIGDGTIEGTRDIKRRRATTENIAGLPDEIQGLASAIAAEEQRATKVESDLQAEINDNLKKSEAHANQNNAHNATSTATPERIIVRDKNGRAQVAYPVDNDDIANQATVIDARKRPDITTGARFRAGELAVWKGKLRRCLADTTVPAAITDQYLATK